MKKFLKSPFNQLVIFFTFVGLFILYMDISYVIYGNPPKCPNIEDGRECWSYLKFWLPLMFFILAGIFYFWGSKIVNKIENKQNNTKN